MTTPTAETPNRFQAIKDRLPLYAVLMRYGVEIPEDTSRHFNIRCRFHDEVNPSMTVYPDNGYHCNKGSCGEHGDIIDLIRHEESPEGAPITVSAALEIAERMADDPDFQVTIRKARAETKRRAEYRHDPLPDVPVMIRESADAMHPYYDEDGEELTRFYRWNARRNSEGEAVQRKRLQAWTRTSEGWVPKGPPKGRPPYMHKLLEHTERGVIIVEGEGTADTLNAKPVNLTTLSWFGGCGMVRDTSWRRLKNWPAPVILVADEDSAGREAMDILAGILRRLGCTVRVCRPGYDAKNPEKSTQTGNDLKDYPEAVASGDSVKDYLKACPFEKLGPLDPNTPEPPKPGGGKTRAKKAASDKFSDGPGVIHLNGDAPKAKRGPGRPRKNPPADDDASGDGGEAKKPEERPDPNDPGWTSNNEYTLLGITRKDFIVVYQEESNLTRVMTRSELYSVPGLHQLCPDENWWFRMAKGSLNTAGRKDACADIILKKARALGVYDGSRELFRGAYKDSKGDIWWHLGNKLLTPAGQPASLKLAPDGRLAIAGAAIAVRPSVNPEKPLIADLWNVTKDYCWSGPADHAAFMGWFAGALAGGALNWRSHIWLTAPASSGKSWLFTDIAHKTFKEFSGDDRFGSGEDTTAAIKRAMNNESLPYLMDEARRPSEDGADKVNNWLPFMRGASGGTTTVRMAEMGTPDGIVTFRPRCPMFLASSIGHDLDDQDASRIVPLSLRVNRLGPEDWLALKERISTVMSDPAEMAAQLMGAVPQLVKLIDRAHAHLTLVCRTSTRMADLLAQVVAGACYARNPADPENELREVAELLITLVEEVMGSAAMNLIRTILSLRIRLDERGEMSVAAMLGKMRTKGGLRDYRRRMNQFGIDLGDDHGWMSRRIEGVPWESRKVKYMAFNPKATQLMAAMAHTPFAGSNLGSNLKNIHGVKIASRDLRWTIATDKIQPLLVPVDYLYASLGLNEHGDSEDDPYFSDDRFGSGADTLPTETDSASDPFTIGESD